LYKISADAERNSAPEAPKRSETGNRLKPDEKLPETGNRVQPNALAARRSVRWEGFRDFSLDATPFSMPV
jgi:hypothetical protein